MKIGDIVFYSLTEEDAGKINAKYSCGAESGTNVCAGQSIPMMVTKINECSVNGRLLTDGTGSPWVDNAKKGYFKNDPGTFRDRIDSPTKYEAAGDLYDAYCHAVGGKAFNGDPLPTWEQFVADSSKQKQVAGWYAAAVAAMNLVK